MQSEVEALQREAGVSNDITDLAPFDIIVSYIPKGGGAMVTDRIKMATFTEIEKGMDQNSKYMEVNLPFIALSIEKNV